VGHPVIPVTSDKILQADLRLKVNSVKKQMSADLTLTLDLLNLKSMGFEGHPRNTVLLCFK